MPAIDVLTGECWKSAGRGLALITAALLLSGCSDAGTSLQAALAPAETAEKELSPLEEAGKAYSQNPKNAEAALAYADLLKQHDRKPEAMAVLQNASQVNNGDRAIMSAYGRLALDQGKLSLARGLLEAADDPSNPDWRVISARGTVLAKEGKHKESIAFFERARPLSNDHASVVNNLALAYMMNGEPDKAEPLLRQAAAGDPANAKVRQNLALVLGLQGKYAEAKSLAAKDLSPENAAANTELLRKITRLEEKPGTRDVAIAESNWVTSSGEPKPVRKAQTPAVAATKTKSADKPVSVGLRGSALETSSTY